MTEENKDNKNPKMQKPPELTPEQKALQVASHASMNRFMGDLSFYMVHQMRTIENGRVHISVNVEGCIITDADFHAESSRDYVKKDKPDA